jgi:hypothetical protein
MSDRELKKISELARQKIKSDISKTDALESFVYAGILKKNGEFTKPYKNLGSVITDNK